MTDTRVLTSSYPYLRLTFCLSMVIQSPCRLCGHGGDDPFPRISPVYYARAVSPENVVRLDNSAPTMPALLKRDFRLPTLI